MTVKLLVDRPIDGKEYKAGNLCDTDDNTEAGLISSKLAIADLTGGTAYVAPPVQQQIVPVTAKTNLLTGGVELSLPSGVPLRVLEANRTVTVKSSGGDFTTVASAISYAQSVVRPQNAKLIIEVDDGTWNIPTTLSGVTGNNFFIKGKNTYAKALTSIDSSSGAAGAWTLVLNLNDVTNVAVNDYVVIDTTTGGTLPSYIRGVFKITGVDAVNNRITVTSKHKAATAPSGAVAGTATIMKTVFNFTHGGNGFEAWDASFLALQDVVLVGSTGGDGISVQDLSRLLCMGVVGLVGWRTGLLVIESGNAVIVNLSVSGCTTGTAAENCSSINMYHGNLTGNGTGSLTERTSNTTMGGNSTVSGNTSGIYASNNSFFAAAGATTLNVTGNTTGVTFGYQSYWTATVLTLAGNGTDMLPDSAYQSGTVYRQGLRLMTTPVYANNAAAIAGGLGVGTAYRTGADPDQLCIVH